MKNNKGFTLVELLIALAILSVVITSVTSIILIGTKQYNKGSADANLQRQAQLVVNQLEDMVIDTNGGVYYTEYTDTREFVLYNVISFNSAVTYTKEVIKWTKVDAKLTYSKWNVDYDSSTNSYSLDATPIFTDQLLAEDISDFKIDLSDTCTEKDKDGNEIDIVQSVQITVGCSDNDGLVSYATSPIITLRNRMILNENPAAVFPNVSIIEENLSIFIAGSTTATPVKIQYPATVVEKGNTYYLHAMINDSYPVDKNLVQWEITSGSTASSVNADGELYIGADENANSLTIKVSYKDDPDKSAVATVKVAGGRSITGVQIIPIPAGNDPFIPKFDSDVTLEGFEGNDRDKLVYTWSLENGKTDWGTIEKNNITKSTLTINQDKAEEGEMLRVHLLVTAPEFGITESNGGKSTYYDFLVPSFGDTMDSYITRGKEVMEYRYEAKAGYYLDNPKETVYFCDKYGNHLEEYDYLVETAVEITSSWYGGINLLIRDVLPVEQAFYLKYIAHCVDGNGNKYDYERIFYIPAVQLIGQSTTDNWGGIDVEYNLDCKLYGYSSYASAAGTGFNGKCEIVEQVVEGNIPEGVQITATLSESRITNADNNIVSFGVFFELSGDLNGVDKSDIKVDSIRIKIKMKDTDIFTYATLTFTE